MRRFIATVAVAGMALAAVLAGGPAAAGTASEADGASATASGTALRDEHPCGPVFTHDRLGLEVQYCPDWAPDNRIPVHETTRQGSEIVGHIHAPGDDWYACQRTGGTYHLGPYRNDWWARTMADNGEWGYVNQVYFRGGDNNEPDRRLRSCFSGDPQPV